MGLLQKVSAGGMTSTKEEVSTNQIQQVQKKSNSVGLLKKSLSVSQNDKLDFFEFIQKYNISLCSLLKLHKGFYNINKSFGLGLGNSALNSDKSGISSIKRTALGIF